MTRLVLSEAEETPLARVLETGFESFNAPFIGEHGYKPLRLMVFRDGEEIPAGGIQAQCYAAWLHVLDVYLPEDLRRTGLGTTLFDRIETEAAARGCVGAYLTTLCGSLGTSMIGEGRPIVIEVVSHKGMIDSARAVSIR